MAEPHKSEKWSQLVFGFEAGVLAVLQLFLIVIIVLTLLSLALLLWHNGLRNLGGVQNVPELQAAVLRGFSGVLLVVLGLELLETLRVYHATHRVRLQVILVVALIAVGRHVMVLDLEHASPIQVVGVASLLLALAAGYYLVGHADRDGLQRQDPH